MPQAPRVIDQCAFILVHFQDSETTAILNEVVEIVLAKKGVKRMVLDSVGEGTYSKFVESLRVPDWILVYFKTKVQISGHVWQASYQHNKAWQNWGECDKNVWNILITSRYG